MKLLQTVAVTMTAWLGAISVLHAWLNLDVSRSAGGGPAFRVGFLPVT
jgi:hypothetical protein